MLQGHDDHEYTFETQCGLFILPTMLKFSLNNKATISQSELIQKFFVSYDACASAAFAF